MDNVTFGVSALQLEEFCASPLRQATSIKVQQEETIASAEHLESFANLVCSLISIFRSFCKLQILFKPSYVFFHAFFLEFFIFKNVFFIRV